MLAVMNPEARVRYLQARARVQSEANYVALLRKEMDFEVAFVKAGGLLLAGPDPTGNGGIVAGFVITARLSYWSKRASHRSKQSRSRA